MNTGNALAINGNVAPLLLRLTHSGGEARNGTMLIPPGGAGMADALQLCGERQSDAQWRVANLCRIAWRSEAGAWQLLNGSYTLVCAHNGERVPVGAAVTVAAGDALELGLLRFVLEPGDGVVPAQMHVAPKRLEDRLDVFDRWAIASPRSEETRHGFDLRDLRDLDGHGSDRRIDTLGDPFGVLDIAGARSRPAADTLAGLLGESPRREARTVPTARPPAPPGLAESVLDELHEEFVRVVRDPDQLAGRTDWEGFVVFGGEAAPTLEELSRQAEPYALLRDILLPREGIDQVIDEFEPLARSGLLEGEPSQDVLGLFAPELVRDARIALPSLTRREHHELSPDSHVRIGSMRVGDGAGGEGAEGEKEGAS
jgi:hypothetical protein